jgi:hypothetical protein
MRVAFGGGGGGVAFRGGVVVSSVFVAQRSLR